MTPRNEHRSERARSEFEQDVLDGLTTRPKTLPCKYFYDTKGSALFEKICETPEYYVTRTEIALLKQACPEVAARVGSSVDILEPGSGAGEKVRLLLDALDEPRSFILIDISKSAVELSASALRESYPELDVVPLVADFTQNFDLPQSFVEKTPHRKLIFFPGSTISNFAPPEAKTFLEGLRRVLSPGDFLFIGVDRVKSRQLLEAAYDDAQGVTAAFNLNLLERIARELPTDLDAEKFRHQALYNSKESRIEMHLVSKEEQKVQIAGEEVHFEAGETIHTENSYKYTPHAFERLAQSAGFELEKSFTDAEELFSLYLCRVP